MGAVCAVVYLLLLIAFIPFAFYKDIVAATSGGGNRDVVLQTEHVETGRYLHRFPHNKVYHFQNASSWVVTKFLLCSWHPTSPVSCRYK
jgi:UDP-N-acetylglucosamine--dolichyl-phosphate N-acetylglucosaminephosphotransferase